MAKYLEDFSIDVGGLWYTYKTEEKMLAQILWRCHFQENVHEDLESGKVDFLREKRKYRKKPGHILRKYFEKFVESHRTNCEVNLAKSISLGRMPHSTKFSIASQRTCTLTKG